MQTKCETCDSSLKEFELNLWNGSATFEIPYCPKCNEIPKVNIPQLKAVSGQAQRGIDKTSGEFRLKVNYPEDFQRDILVKVFPSYQTTVPREWRYSKRRGVYKTKGRVAKVYPELKQKDIVNLVGLWEEGIPMLCTLMHNATIGATSSFLQNEINIQKGFLSSFTVKNPILSYSENLLLSIIDEQESII